MLIKKEDSVKIANSESCTVWEYLFPSKEFGVATALINGNYPEEDWVVNEKCDSICFILSGEGSIYCDKEVFNVKPRDAVFIKKGARYKYVGKQMEIIDINAPAWFPEQYKAVK